MRVIGLATQEFKMACTLETVMSKTCIYGQLHAISTLISTFDYAL